MRAGNKNLLCTSALFFIIVNSQHVFISFIIVIFIVKQWSEFNFSTHRSKIIHNFLLCAVQYIMKNKNYPQIEKILVRSRNHCLHGKPKTTYLLYRWATRSRQKCKTYCLYVKSPMFLFEYKKIGISRRIFIKVYKFGFFENSIMWRRADNSDRERERGRERVRKKARQNDRDGDDKRRFSWICEIASAI
jgi:hypothetical protein